MKQYSIYITYLIIFAAIFSFVNAQENTFVPLSTTNKAEKSITIASEDYFLEYEKVLKKANALYKKQQYSAALIEYTQSLKYLTTDDVITLKRLGDTYTKIAETYKRIKNREKTAYFYKKSLDIFTQINNKKYMARTLNTLAEAERYLGNLVIALDNSIASLKIHNTIDDPKGYAKALMGAGIIYRHIGLYEKSLEHIHKAYVYYKKVSDYNGIAKTSNEMGLIYIRLEQFDQAKYFFQQTINIPEQQLQLNVLASALREMAVIHFSHGDYTTAILSAQKAYHIYQNTHERTKESLTARIIANAYREQKDTVNAINYYKRSLAIAVENNNEIYQIKAQTPLASMMIKNNIDEAIRLLLSSLKIAIKNQHKGQTLYAYRTLRQAEEHRGDFKKALSYAKKEINLIKAIQKESDSKNLTLAKAALHSSKIEIELESLRERTKLDQLELTKKNNEIEIVEQARLINELELIKNQYASLTLAFLLAICVFLAFFIYRRFVVSKKRNKELNYLASRDSLTHCYNRRGLFELMNKHLSNTKINNEYCIIMADIDHFKSINDTYGHNVGDTVIQGFATTLQNSVRQNDIVARYGGEEFCIVLHQVSEIKAIAIAESMREKIEKSTFDNVSITCSFGITSSKFGAINTSELIEQADLALYKSKALGRNRTTVWNDSLNTNDFPVAEK